MLYLTQNDPAWILTDESE